VTTCAWLSCQTHRLKFRCELPLPKYVYNIGTEDLWDWKLVHLGFVSSACSSLLLHCTPWQLSMSPLPGSLTLQLQTVDNITLVKTSVTLYCYYYYYYHYLCKLQMGFYPVPVYYNKTQHTNNTHHTNNTAHKTTQTIRTHYTQWITM
jgi:hypothetical protein